MMAAPDLQIDVRPVGIPFAQGASTQQDLSKAVARKIRLFASRMRFEAFPAN